MVIHDILIVGMLPCDLSARTVLTKAVFCLP